MSSNTSFERIVHFRHAGERPAIEAASDYINSLIIPAHFAAEYPEVIAGVLSLNPDFEYYIEPRLPEYHHGDNFWKEIGEQEVAPWDAAMIDYYDDLLENILLIEGNLNVSNLDRSQITLLAEQCCSFQVNYVDDNTEELLSRYGVDSDPPRPRAIIPWFVQIRDEDSLDFTIDIAGITSDFTNYHIKPCYWIGRDYIISSENRELLIESVKELPGSEMFVLIDELDKRETERGHYMAVIDLINGFSENGMIPNFLHGDFFAYLLSYFGLRGSGVGISYSESRTEKLESTEGGGPGNRYYFPELKEFLDPTDAQTLGEEHNSDFCTCPVCDEYMDSWGDIHRFAIDRNELVRHHLAVREQEAESIDSSDLQDMLEELTRAHDTYADTVTNMGIAPGTDHLEKWPDSIRQYVQFYSDLTFDDFTDGYNSVGT